MIHRLTLDAAVTEFLRTHAAGGQMLLAYMASVAADPLPVETEASLDSSRPLAEFNRMRRKAILNMKDGML